MREGLRAHGETEVKHLGDGIMATFASPSAALTCAVSLQQIASRVCARARTGQILAQEAVRQIAGVKGFKFGEGRSVTLKGFPGRVRLYEVEWTDQ